MARRLCLDHHRKRYGRPRGSAPSAEQAHAARRQLLDLVAEDLDPALLPDGAPADPESQLETEEVRRALAAAVGELGPRDRLLLKLRFEDDAPVREIARLLEYATPFHVYRRLNAVCAGLRHALRRRGVEEPLP